MSMPTISPKDAKRLIDQGASLVDIRSSDERAREFIQGSQHIPLTNLGRLAGMDSPIIFYCRTGIRTAQNAASLRAATSGEAFILEDGLEGWKEEGLPLEIDTSKPIEMPRQVMIGAGALVLLFTLLGAFTTPLFYALAGLVGAGLVFGGATGFCGMARLLAFMPWNRSPAGA
ncbi:MAG: rhodanese family protein [Pseudomonadota bacterium]